MVEMSKEEQQRVGVMEGALREAGAMDVLLAHAQKLKKVDPENAVRMRMEDIARDEKLWNAVSTYEAPEMAQLIIELMEGRQAFIEKIKNSAPRSQTPGEGQDNPDSDSGGKKGRGR